jgi:hypothetical protein
VTSIPIGEHVLPDTDQLRPGLQQQPEPAEHCSPIGRHRRAVGVPPMVAVERPARWWRRHLTAAGRRAARRATEEEAAARHAAALAAARAETDRWRHRAVLAEEALAAEHAAAMTQLLHASARHAERDAYRQALGLACVLLVAVDAAVAGLLRPAAVLELPAGDPPGAGCDIATNIISGPVITRPSDDAAGGDLAAVG